MTRALAVRGAQRDPSQASARLRRAAEHYVRGGCKAIGPSLRWAGFAALTAKEPTKNGYSHDRLVQIAAYYDTGAQATARSHLGEAVATLRGIMVNPLENAQARGAAAKVIIDVGKKEEEKEDRTQVAVDEQAKWMALIRHWKRTFLRRGILLGMGYVDYCVNPNCHCTQCECSCNKDVRENRVYRLLAELNYQLGKGPCPEWINAEEETDGEGEGLQRPEGDTRHAEDGEDAVLEAEIVPPERTDPAA